MPCHKGWIFFICFTLSLSGFSSLCFFSALCFPSSNRHGLSYRCQAQWGMQTQQESTAPHSPQHTHICLPIPPIQSHKQHHSALCWLTLWEPNADIHCGSWHLKSAKHRTDHVWESLSTSTATWHRLTWIIFKSLRHTPKVASHLGNRSDLFCCLFYVGELIYLRNH